MFEMFLINKLILLFYYSGENLNTKKSEMFLFVVVGTSLICLDKLRLFYVFVS